MENSIVSRLFFLCSLLYSMNNLKAQGIECRGYEENRYESINSLGFERKAGIYDSAGNVKYIFGDYVFGTLSEGLMWICEPHEYNSRGYYNRLGQKQISILYDTINKKFYPLPEFSDDFRNGYAKVRNGAYEKSRVGYIDRLGNLTIGIKYQDGGSFNFGLTYVKLNGKYGFVNSKGKVKIPFIYDGARDFSCGLAAVKSLGKWGFVDTTGRVVIPFIFQSVLSFTNDYCRVRFNNKYGIIDKKNNKIIDFKFDFLTNVDSNIVVFRLGDEWGIVKSNGEILLRGLKNCVQANRDLLVCQSEQGFFLVNSKGVKLNDVLFQSLKIVNESFLIGKFNNLYYHLDRSGIVNQDRIYNELLSKNYYDFDFYYNSVGKDNWVSKSTNSSYRGFNALPSSGLYIYRKNKKYGLISAIGSIITEPIYDDILKFNDGFVWTETNSKFGVVNEYGEQITLKRNYYWVQDFHSVDKVCQVGIIDNGVSRWGFIDLQGNEIIPLIYTRAFDFKAGFAQVGLGQEHGYSGGKYGVINLKNEIVIPIIYEYENLARKPDNTWAVIPSVEKPINQNNLTGTVSKSAGVCSYKIASKPIKWTFIDNRKYCKYCHKLLPCRKLTPEEISNRKKNAMIHIAYEDLTNHWLTVKNHNDDLADIEYQAFLSWQKSLGLTPIELMFGNSMLNTTSMMSIMSMFTLGGIPSMSQLLTEINLYSTTDDEFCHPEHQDRYYRRY